MNKYIYVYYTDDTIIEKQELETNIEDFYQIPKFIIIRGDRVFETKKVEFIDNYIDRHRIALISVEERSLSILPFHISNFLVS